MSFDEFLQALAAAIDGFDPVPLRPDSRLREIPQWDSLAVLSATVLADIHFGAEVRGSEVMRCSTLGELHQLFESRRASNG